jgi:hypothetical protein
MVSQKSTGLIEAQIFVGTAAHPPPLCVCRAAPATKIDGCRSPCAQWARERLRCCPEFEEARWLRRKGTSRNCAVPRIPDPRRQFRVDALEILDPRRQLPAGGRGIGSPRRPVPAGGREIRSPQRRLRAEELELQSFALETADWRPMVRSGAAKRWFICLPRSWRRCGC